MRGCVVLLGLIWTSLQSLHSGSTAAEDLENGGSKKSNKSNKGKVEEEPLDASTISASIKGIRSELDVVETRLFLQGFIGHFNPQR